MFRVYAESCSYLFPPMPEREFDDMDSALAYGLSATNRKANGKAFSVWIKAGDSVLILQEHECTATQIAMAN